VKQRRKNFNSEKKSKIFRFEIFKPAVHSIFSALSMLLRHANRKIFDRSQNFFSSIPLEIRPFAIFSRRKNLARFVNSFAFFGVRARFLGSKNTKRLPIATVNGGNIYHGT
jgi:hypothetical protein